MKKILDLGCGVRRREGAVGIDINPKTGADIIHDLNNYPYPFDPSTFDEIYADNVIEHLADVIKVMEELHRIAKPNALIKIDVPYFRAQWAFIDPTHKHFFTTESFSYFDPEHINHKLYPYSAVGYKVEKIVFFNERIEFAGKIGAIKNLIKKFANKHLLYYENILSSIVPMDALTFYLRVLK